MVNKKVKSILFVLIAAIMLLNSATVYSQGVTQEENNEDSYEAGSGKEAADSTGLDSGLGLEEISDVSEYDAESYVLTPDNQNEEKIKVSLKSEMVTQDDTFCVELIFGEDVSDYYFVTDTISVIKDDTYGDSLGWTMPIYPSSPNNLNTSTCEYTLPQSTWDYVLSHFSGYATIKLAVGGFRDFPGLTSGPFMSKLKTINITIPSITTINMASSERYKEEIATLQSGSYKDFIVSFAVGGNKILQTFGAKDSLLELYNMNGTQLDDDDDAGYSTNALLSYNFAANTQYRIRVKFYSATQFGDIKLAIMPAEAVTNYEGINIQTNATGCLTWYVNQNQVRLIRYNYTTAKTATFQTSSAIDTYLYIIDPRSTEAVVQASSSTTTKPCLFDDDSGGNRNAKITKSMDANIPYLVIVSAYNPSASSGSFSLCIS